MFGYCALTLELLAYAAQMVYLPNLSKKYKPFTLTAMYYTVATVASAGTLILRERDDLLSVRCEPSPSATLHHLLEACIILAHLVIFLCMCECSRVGTCTL